MKSNLQKKDQIIANINKNLKMTTRIKVGIRLRPFLESELQKGYENQRISYNEETKEVQISEDGRRERKTFKFDHVFGTDSTQSSVYETSNIDYLLNKVVEGYHCTIFAYGQTGSGKTHTMEGYEYELAPSKDQKIEGGISKPRPKQHQDPQRVGIIPRAISSLFDKLRAKEGGEFNVTCSFLQIYNEKIYDLLNPNSIKQSNSDGTPVLSQGLRLRWNQREQFQVENLFVFDCKSAEEVMNFFHYGIRNRVTASHKLNMASSRSHTILTLRIESIDLSTQSSSFSKLELVDLAGSERIGQTGTEGKLAKESIDINKSLFILRQVISTLSDINKGSKQKDSSQPQYQHVPYRESKLTSLLKQSIGGNSYCLMLACINPCDSFVDENLSTLNYATKATYIKNEPIRNDDPKNKAITDLRSENNRLKLELDKANQHISFISTLNNSGGIGGNHPPNCCLPNCKYGGAKGSDLSSTQMARMSIQANQEGNEGLDSPESGSSNNQNSNKPMSINNFNKMDSFQSTARESLTNFSNLSPKLFNSTLGGGLNQNTVNQLQHQSFIQQQQLLQRINTLQLQNQHLSNQNINRISGNGDYDNFSDRLIESIAMVRDLLQNNKELRETTDQAIKKGEICEKELFHLQRENQDLRDRIQHLKNGGQLEDFNSSAPNFSGTDDENSNLFSNQPLSPSINWKNMSKKELISEILALRRDKKILERRILGFDVDRSTIGSSQQLNLISNPPQIRIQNRRMHTNNSPIKQNYSSASNQQHTSQSFNRKFTPSNQSNNSSNNNMQSNGTPFQGDSIPTNFGRYTFYQNIQQNNVSNNSMNLISDDQLSQTQRSNQINSISQTISPQNAIQSYRQVNILPRPFLQNISPGKRQQPSSSTQIEDFNPKQNYNINTKNMVNRSNSIKTQNQSSHQQNTSYSQQRPYNPNQSFHY